MRIFSQFTRDEAQNSMFSKVMWLLIVGYFTFHLVQGERGILSMWRLQSQLDHSEHQLQSLQQQRESMERHVQLLHPDHLDADMLDEQARINLGYSAPGEIMVILPQK